MVRLWITSPRDYPSPDHWSPEFVDLDSYIPDFDPVKEWLVDPDHAPLMASEESEVPNPDGHEPKIDGSAVSGELLSTSIYEKMEKVRLVECAGSPNNRDGEQRDGLDVLVVESVESKESGDEYGICVDSSLRGSEVQDESDGFLEVVKVDGGNDVFSVSDSIKLACKSKGESNETESDEMEDDSSSTDGSSSSSGEDDDIDDGDGGRSKVGVDEVVDIEEGEIRDLNQEEVAMCSDEDDEVIKGPIKSRHEIEVLPPVPQVEVFLEPHHRTHPVGVISSILGIKVIVEGSEKHSPVSEGSILWITETRSPLGLVDEIFGPVKSPYYVVRYNSEKELPAGISVGAAISFVMEFATHILNDQDIYKKGYDASGENDEEASDEVEFSDDEKEAEYKKSMRQSKRVLNNRRGGNRESSIDKRTNFKGAPSNDRWHGNKESAIDKRTNFKFIAANHRWHGNKKSPIDKEITNFNGAPIKSHVQPPVPGAPPAMGPPLPSVTGSLQASPVTANFGYGSRFSDPSQQFLLQQANAILSQGFQPQLQQMCVLGQYPMNVSPIPQVGNTAFQHQNQNQVFNSFPNAMPGHQQFIPNFGAPANVPWLGGPLNLSSGPTSLGPMGQPGINQAPFGCSTVHQQGTSGPCNAPVYGQPPPSMQFNPSLGPAGMPPMQFNQSMGPTSFAAPMGQFSQAPFGCGNSQAPFGCGNVHEQGASGSHNPSSYGQPQLAIVQGGFNAPMNPTSLGGPMGQQFSVGQASFGSGNMHEQGNSGSRNGPSHVQPPSAAFQGGMRPMQFNPGSSPFRGGKNYQRGGRHSFGRGSRLQNG